MELKNNNFTVNINDLKDIVKEEKNRKKEYKDEAFITLTSELLQFMKKKKLKNVLIIK